MVHWLSLQAAFFTAASSAFLRACAETGERLRRTPCCFGHMAITSHMVTVIICENHVYYIYTHCMEARCSSQNCWSDQSVWLWWFPKIGLPLIIIIIIQVKAILMDISGFLKSSKSWTSWNIFWKAMVTWDTRGTPPTPSAPPRFPQPRRQPWWPVPGPGEEVKHGNMG